MSGCGALEVPISPFSGKRLRDLRNRRNCVGVQVRLCRIAWLQSGDAGCIAGAVSICSRSGTLAIPLWSPVKMRRRLQSPQPRSPQRERDWAVEPAKLLSYGCTGSLLPPTDLASAGHEDQEGGGGDAMRFIEAQPTSRRPALYSVSLAPSTSGAACPGQSPVTPPDRVLSLPCKTDTI